MDTTTDRTINPSQAKLLLGGSNAEDTVRKLWQAIEQSADLVLITDRAGVIEYVNPAFEALTGYSREEAIGQTSRLLKSEQQTPELYQELWATILSGNVFRGVLANRKKSGEIFYAEKSITPCGTARARLHISSLMTATSPNGGGWKRSYSKRRKWTQSASSPGVSPMILTTC